MRVVQVEQRPIDRFLRVTGSLAADEQAEVAAEIGGRVIGTPVERGSRVAAGSVLVRLSGAEADASLREAEANAAQLEARLGLAPRDAFDPARVPDVLNARASLDWAEADFNRIKALLDQHVVSQAEYDQRSAQVQAARQQYQSALNGAQQAFRSLEAARARVDLARKAAADTVVRAPFAGLVGERLVGTGDYVSKGTKVATIVRVDPVRVELTVPEQYLSQVRTDQPVRLSVDPYPGEVFAARVRFVSPALKADQRALTVEAVAPNSDGRLKPGLFATALLQQLVAGARAARADGRGRNDGGNEPRVRGLERQPGRGAHRDARRPRRGSRRGRVGRQGRRTGRRQSPRQARRRGPRPDRGVAVIMQWLAAISVKRPVFASVLILTLTVIGAFSFSRLGLDRFPKVDFPTVVVTTRLPGAAPEEIETEISDKIEEAVNTISGIDELRSTSSEGVSTVIISFLLEKDVDVASQDVRDRVNRVLPLLPRNVLQPTVEKFDPDSSPVMTLAVSADKPIRDITEYADKTLRRQLESVSGVGQVMVIGGRQRQINITLDPARLQAHNVTVTDVSRALASQNAEIPGGRVEAGATQMTLRTRGRVQSVKEFGDVVVRERDGHPILLGDVAAIEDGMAEPTTKASVNGRPTVLLAIRRQSGVNTVEMVDAVRERLDEIAVLTPPGYSVVVVRDLSDFIRASIDTVKDHLIVGSFLAALVVLLFLWNWRSTLIAAVAIPTSIVATFGLIWFEGFTLNSMTMLALTLAVGIVIDDAIVVLENIYRFIEEKGMNPFEAAVQATREIGLAVLATTLSLIAIFVPVGFMGGIVGRFMKSFGLTMSFAILVSLLVSFTLTPMLSARWIKGKGVEGIEGVEGEPVLQAGGRALSPAAVVGARPPRPRGRRGRADSAQQRPALHAGEQELPARRRPVRVRSRPPGAGGRQPRRHRAHRQPDRGRHPAPARGGLHARHDCRRPGRDAERRDDLRAAEAARRAAARSVHRHERRARERGAGLRGPEPPHRREAGRDDWRRRKSERRDPVHHQRSGPRQARDVFAADCRTPRGSSRASSTSIRR